MVRSLFVLLLVAAAAPSASAQFVNRPLRDRLAPAPNISDTPGMNAWQAGRLFNRPLFAGPASAHPISRPFWMSPYRDPDNYWGGTPFQNRPFLNIAINAALR